MAETKRKPPLRRPARSAVRQPSSRSPKKSAGRGGGGLSVAAFRRLALGVPGAIERPSYGTPGFRVKDKLFARVLPDDEHVVVRVTREQRAAMLDALPAVFSLTPHYEPYDWVIVSLAAAEETLLRDLLAEAAAVATGR